MLTRRVIQIHVTRRCNLACLHCYSESGPQVSQALAPAAVFDVLADAAAEGYEVASFSGGEPLLYAHLADCLEHAKSLGLRTTVTTNGMPLSDRRARTLARHLDLLAISLDGKPERHNEMRGSDHAFRLLEKNLSNFRRYGIVFGFIHTVTEESLADLRWVVEFAVSVGARLVQLHPLEMVGSAKHRLSDRAVDREVCTRAYLLGLLLQQEFGDAINLHTDVFNVLTLMENPGLVHSCRDTSAYSRLSDLVNPLIIDSDGTVLPVCYGIDRRFAIGNINQRPLATLAKDCLGSGLRRFDELCGALYDDEVLAKGDTPLPYFNWYELLAQRSHRFVEA